MHFCVLMCPKTNTCKALKEPPLWIAIFLAVEYSTRGCHNKGNNKRGHVPALHGVSITINRRKGNVRDAYASPGKLISVLSKKREN